MKAVSCLIGFCLLAVAVNADFAWQKGQQYKYQVRGRAMAGISGLPNQYAGIQLEYYQIVTVKSDGVLNVKTEDLKIVDTNEELENGNWRDGQIRKGEEPSIPQELKHFLSSPMDLIVKQGVVEAIKVQGDLPTWAVNIKRAMASEFTMDTIGQHQYIQGNLHRHLEGQTPEEQNQESGFFYKVEEESVHGICPVYYTVSQNGPFDAPFQFQAQRQAGANTGRSSGSSESQENLEGKRQYGNRAYKAYKNAKKSGSSRSVESQEDSSKEQVWPRAFNQLCEQNDQVYEIIKVTNFTACSVKPVLGYNSPAGQHAHPGDNAAGSLSSHALVSRLIACGQSRKNFTILQINQQEKFLTGLRNIEKVEGGAQKNITLISIRQGHATPIENPKTIKSLVYQYDPKEQNQVMKGKLQYAKAPGASGSQESSESEESMAQYSAECQGQNARQCRHELRQQQKQQQQRQYGQQQKSSQEWQQQQKLAKPELDQAPLASMPITPLKLESLKTRVISLMQDIAQGLVKSTEKDSIAKREILSKISTVVKALRRFNRPAINELAQKLTQSGNEIQDVTRSIFLDALAIAGTNPTTVYLLEQVEAGQLNGEEAAQTISTLVMSIRTPTRKLIQRFFAIIDSEVVKRQQQVRTTAMLAFSNLLFNACVNKEIKNTRYPVALYGSFCEESDAEKYVPFFVEKLEKRLDAQDQEQGQNKHWIVTLLATLGNIGHPRVIEVVQKIMDEQTDSFIKTKAVFALKHLIVSRARLNQQYQQQYSASRIQQGSQRLPIPADRQSRDILTNEVVEKQVLPLLMSVGFDRGEHPQVRNAALSLLLHCTYADVAIWQQIALATWFEPSRDVRSFVLSSLKSLAELSTPIQGQQWNMKTKAASVLPLAKPIDASVLRSHNLFSAKFIEELNSGFAQQLTWFQGEDSILPNNLYYRNFLQFGNSAVGVHPVEFSVTGNTIQKLANAFVRAVYENQQEQQQQKEGHQDLSEIKNLLNIEPRKQGEPVQGSIHLKLREEIERMWTFDEETLVQIAQQIRQAANAQGELNINYQKAVYLAESMASMPTIFGFPLVFEMRMPALISVRGTLKLENPQGKEVTLQADLAPVYAWKIHTQVAFKVPFTGKKYQAGVQRHFVVEAPFSAVARRSPQGELQLALTPAHLSSGAPSGTINLITYHQIPYTAIITDEFYPTNAQQGGKMQIIHANKDQKDNYQNKRHYGQNALGLAFEIEEQSEFPEQVENMSGWAKFVRRFHSAGCAFNAAWLGSSHLRYAKREIVLDIEKSETKTIVLLLAARVQRESVARQLQSSEEGQSKESQSNSQSTSQSESGSKSGSSSSSSSESVEGKQWFNIVKSPAARRQQQERQQKKQQKQQQNGGIRQSAEFSSSESSESQSQSRESQSGRKHRKPGHVVVLALLGKKAPLTSVDELKSQLGKQRALQAQSDNTVQYLAQLNLRHGQVFLRLAAGSAANQAAENLPESSKAFRAIREQVKQGDNSKSQPEACIEFEGTMDTPKKASRHIVAIRRHTLLAQDLSVKVQGKLTAGQNCRAMPLFVKIQGKLRRDQEMTEWARSKSPEAQKCKKDEQKGFTISQICMDVAEQQAAALNEYKFTIEHSQMPKAVQNMTVYHVQNLLKAALYPYMSENQFPQQSTVKPNTFQLYARMTPNKQFLSMEIRKPESVLTFSNVKTGRFIKAVLPLTASQTLYSNIKDRLLRSQSDSMCALEKNFVNTFDNVTYSFNQQAARGCQHVLAKDCSGRYPMAVLVKDLQQTKGRTVTVILGKHKIELIPQGGESRTSPKISKSQKSQESFESQEQGVRGASRMTVIVDEQRKEQLPITIRYGNKKSFVAEVMEMPNGGVQVIGRRIQVATDGARVIVYAANQLRNRTCGICGDFDNEKVAEMRSPKDFPLSSGTLLVASYAFKPLKGQSQGQCEVDQQVQRQVRKEQEQGEQQDRYIANIHQRGQHYQQKQQERRQQQQQYRKQQQTYQKQQQKQQQQQQASFYGNIFGGRRNQEQSSESREYRQHGQQFNQHKLQQKQQQYRQQQSQQSQHQQQHEKPQQFRQHIQQNPQNRQEVCFSVASLPACRQGFVASKTTPKTVQAHCVQKKTQHAKELKNKIQQGEHVDLAHKQQQPVHIQSPIECIPRAFGQRSSGSSSESREYSREEYRGHRLSSVQQREDATGKVHETNWQIQGFKATWGRRSAEFCKQGQYVYGMKLTGDSADARDNQQDQRGLTAVEFLCATPYARQQQEGVVRDARQSDKITSQKAQGGNKVEEKQAQVCPQKSFVTGVQVHADFNNQHDKTAINSVDLICSNGKTIRGDTVFQGNQKKVLECQAGKRLCGLQTQVEDLQRTSTDHYGLVNMKIQCC